MNKLQAKAENDILFEEMKTKASDSFIRGKRGRTAALNGSMIKAVIFDMDGVIIDSEPVHYESDLLTLRYFGIEITHRELDQYVGVSNPVMWAELREKYKLADSVEALMEKQSDYKNFLFGEKKLEPIAGIPELLSEIKNAGVTIGLASSSNRDFIEMILRNLEIISFFDCIVSGEEVKRSKPAPDIFLKAAASLCVQPNDCLVIEDSEHGVKAAKAAGMECIGFCNPSSGKQDLSLADTIVHSICQIHIRDYRQM